MHVDHLACSQPRDAKRRHGQGFHPPVVILERRGRLGFYLSIIDIAVHGLVHLQEAPLGDGRGVLSDKHIRTTGLFVGPRQLDGVIGLRVNVRLVLIVGQQRLLTNDHVGDNIVATLQGHAGAIVIHDIDDAGIEEGLLQRPFNNVEAGLLLLN